MTAFVALLSFLVVPPLFAFTTDKSSLHFARSSQPRQDLYSLLVVAVVVDSIDGGETSFASQRRVELFGATLVIKILSL